MADGARLESVFRLIPNESSNLSLSANLKKPSQRDGFFKLSKSADDNPYSRAKRVEFDKKATTAFLHGEAAPKG